MSSRFAGLTPRDRHIAEVLEYQAGKGLDEAMFTETSGLVDLYNKEGTGGEIELFMDDIIKLPDGAYVRLSWDIDVVPEEEIKMYRKALRKPPVRVNQDDVEGFIVEHGEQDMETVALAQDCSIATAKRHLDGLVYQGRLEVERHRPDRTSIYRVPGGSK